MVDLLYAVLDPARAGDLMRTDAATAAGLAITLALVLVALLAPWLAPHDPYATDPARALRSPSRAHPFGTGVFGEDVFSRVLWGTRLDLLIAGGAVGIALVLGGALGAVAGFAGGLTDEGCMRAMDVLQAFPNFVLALGIAAALGPSLPNLIVAIALTNVPVYARLMRSQVLTQRMAPYALAAVGVGNPDGPRAVRPPPAQHLVAHPGPGDPPVGLGDPPGGRPVVHRPRRARCPRRSGA